MNINIMKDNIWKNDYLYSLPLNIMPLIPRQELYEDLLREGVGATQKP